MDYDDVVVCPPQARRKQRLISVVLLLGLQMVEQQPDNIYSARCLRRTGGFDSAMIDVLRRCGGVSPPAQKETEAD